jgi:hypothetical protein
MTDRMIRRADVVDVEAVELARPRAVRLWHGFKTGGAVFWRSAGLQAFVSGAAWGGVGMAVALAFFLFFALAAPGPFVITWSLVATCGAMIGGTALWCGAMAIRSV